MMIGGCGLLYCKYIMKLFSSLAAVTEADIPRPTAWHYKTWKRIVKSHVTCNPSIERIKSAKAGIH